VHAGVGVDLELPLPRLALLFGLIEKAARSEVAASHPRFEVLMDVVPQRPAVDQEPEVHRLHAADGVDTRDLHGGRADAEGAAARSSAAPRSPTSGRAARGVVPAAAPSDATTGAPATLAPAPPPARRRRGRPPTRAASPCLPCSRGSGRSRRAA